jgi:hypothetical protein
MARRSPKADAALIILLIVVGIPLVLVGKIVESIGGEGAGILLVTLLGTVIWYQRDKKKKRLEYLRAKYVDEDTVRKILDGYLWQGQSEEQLRDSIGTPVAVDRKVLRTKTKEIWKYQQQGANRFGLRVTVEDGYVVGWDKKT